MSDCAEDSTEDLDLNQAKTSPSYSKINFNDLEQLKRSWVATLDAIKDPISIIDRNYNIIKCNLAMAKLTKHQNVKKLIGVKCYKVFTGKQYPCKGCTALLSMKSNNSSQFIFESTGDKDKKDKKDINDISEDKSDNKIYEISSFPISDTDGKITSSVQVYRDRTVHIKMQERIIQHDKLTSLGLLAAGIASEINNPLSGILLFSQMLLKELDNAHEHYQDIVEIESGAQRCKEIINQIVEFSRQGKLDIAKNLDPVNLKDVIASSLRFSQVLKVAKDCKISLEFDNPEIIVLGCRNRLVQVFLHLFNNAFQSMPEGGRLTIIQSTEIYHGKKHAKVEIRDCGMGIKKENLNKIFDPFFTTKKSHQANGLGLSICYGIIRELHGELTVSSCENNGSSFFVYLQIKKTKAILREISHQDID